MPHAPATAASPYVVALTGGIAAGKSATSDRFAQRGVPVFDADLAARAVVAPDQPALTEIVAAFGPAMLGADGTLDRARLRERVFAVPDARRTLEAIVHPRVHATLLAQVRACRAPYCVLAIPLFVECRADYAWVDRVLVTDVPPALQRERLLRRPGIDAATAAGILAAQATRAARLALAQDVIDNTAPIEWLDHAVARLHLRYAAAAQALRGG